MQQYANSYVQCLHACGAWESPSEAALIAMGAQLGRAE